ncbi:pyrroline-5-carboxylate reductase [Proteinivorax tanatarense]|uniref:Pyrroline-5-carboxylate reductase n=1 Tax=Proteinivorax tanatarense TaxID=1260629 RepID=A0AAU7VMV6_9FIRM
MKLGFIGCGNMAQAIIKGIIDSKLLPKEDIIASDNFEPCLDKAEELLGIQTTIDNKKIVEDCEIVILAIKPQGYFEIIKEISPSTSKDTIIVTIAPGITLASLEKAFSKEIKIIRTMPNTPSIVREGMTAICYNSLVEDNEVNKVKELFEAVGAVEIVPEDLMDVVVAASGSSPAYVFMFIEAMADAAVLLGMDRKQAYRFASQAVMGSAKMLIETGKHPAELKDMVCSPAGATIEAVKTLESCELRSSVIKAMVNCANRSKSIT